VWLPSGGSLVIDRTEAMTVVDVNTGKFVGSGGNLEETVTKNNIEAAEELVRQLRLRDIGGIIVVDFIDMVLETNRDLVLRRLVECLSRDRTKHQVAEVTSLGLVQMTRKKLGLGLMESFQEIGVDRQQAQEQQQQNRQKSQERRRAKAQNGPARSGAPTSPAHPITASTHAITDDVKNALAKIAASTIAHGDGETASTASETAAAVEAAIDAVAASIDPAAGDTAPAADDASSAGAAAPAPESGSGRSRRGRGRRASSSTQAAAPQAEAPADTAGLIDVPATEPAAVVPTVEPTSPVVDIVDEIAPAARPEKASRRSQATVTSSEATVAILDIPVAKVERAPRRISTHDAEQILDSVLGALPEPKQPGQGRSRSRRASSTGTVSAPAPSASADGAPATDGPAILGVGVASDDL
jgi:ribonuclease E